MTSIHIAGISYSLAHVGKFSRKVEVPLRGIALPKKVRVDFHFSNHCYSRGANGEDIPQGYLIPDGSAKFPRHRIFDLRRYELSKGLVGHIDSLIAANGEVSKSRHDNFFSVSDVYEDVDGVQVSSNYFVFMSARKVSERNQEKHIHVHVESAYPETPNVPHPDRVRSQPFASLLGEIWSSK